MNAIDQQLCDVRSWAKSMLATGAEPPWSWYQYMKLVETLDAILASRATTTTADSPQPEPPLGKHLRLVGRDDPQESVPHHPVGIEVLLPM